VSGSTPVVFAGTGERDRDHAPGNLAQHVLDRRAARGAVSFGTGAGLVSNDDVLGLRR
jgi:hypothetical protein